MDELKRDITSFERRVWDALVAGDAEADRALLDPDFIGVYSDGFAGRSDHEGQLAHGATIAHYALDQITVKPIGANHALICYYATFQRIANGAPEAMFVSSLWERRAPGWINIFSQDTPAA